MARDVLKNVENIGEDNESPLKVKTLKSKKLEASELKSKKAPKKASKKALPRNKLKRVSK